MTICFYLTEIVVDVKAPASQQQEADQLVDDGHLPVHHSDMESSVIKRKDKIKMRSEMNAAENAAQFVDRSIY